MVFLAAESLLAEGFSNMLVGLFVVFSVLIFLSIIIWAFKFLGGAGAGKVSAQAAAVKAPASAPAPGAKEFVALPVPGTMAKSDVNFEDEVDGAVAAAILGAMAQELGGNFKVTSIKKSK
ncbi:MAG: OadG family protein [Lachnospiraceae bacterium]|nr:OadG family protein [Lachnospiraceae bacterium]